MAEPNTKHIAIVTGSTRVVRIGPQVVKFVTEIVERELSSSGTDKTPTFTLSQVEISTFKLPVFDEAVVPATVPLMAQFVHEHSKAWSAEMSKYDGYILVTGEYNKGPPGAVKNAIDYLYNEIKGKPFLIVSYGVEGGQTSSTSLMVSLKSMFTHVMETRPMLKFARNEPLEYGTALDLRLAGTGKLGEDSLKDWQAQKGEIAKGFGELKEFLSKAPETKVT